MKQFKRFKWVAGVLLVTNAMANTGHAKNTKSKQEVEDCKLTGSFLFGKHYDFDFQTAKTNNKKYSILNHLNLNKLANVGLGIEQVLPLGEDTIRLVIQTKLSERSITLKRAKIENENFVAGLTDSNFCDGDAAPGTLFGNDAPNTVSNRVAQIGWKHQSNEELSFSVTLENSFVGLQELPTRQEFAIRGKKVNAVKKTMNVMPTVGAHVKYEEDFGYVRLGGLFRANRLDTKGKTAESGLWGINVTSVIDLSTDQTVLKMAGLYGKGLGEYLEGSTLLERDVPSVFVVQNKTRRLGTLGASIGLEHCWLPALRSTFAYGILSGTNHKKYKGDIYKQSHYASASLTYHPTENLMYGVEYAYDKLWALSKAGDKSKHRIQAAVGFKF